MTETEVCKDDPRHDEFVEQLKKMGFKPGGIRYDEVTGEPYETWVSDLGDPRDDDSV